MRGIEKCLQSLSGDFLKPRVSMYADDAVIFLSPTTHDMTNLSALLENFGEVTGLATNVAKSSVAPIRCTDIDLTAILQNFHATLSPVPLNYMGLPLSPERLRKVNMEPYIDKASSKLNPWKANFLNRDSCAELVKSVLTSMPIFLLTAIKADKGTVKALDKIRCGMLWACSENVSGGKCKVRWTKPSLLRPHLRLLLASSSSQHPPPTHPTSRKRSIAVQRCAAVAVGAAASSKKLRLLPHVFTKVLELPFAAYADVAVKEDAEELRFVAAADGFSPGSARAHVVEIHPGVTKVVVRDLFADICSDDEAAAFELDGWRFRLPSCTRPAMATATYAEGELVVTVPVFTKISPFGFVSPQAARMACSIGGNVMFELHSHSNHSDGFQSPSVLMQHAHRNDALQGRFVAEGVDIFSSFSRGFSSGKLQS